MQGSILSRPRIIFPHPGHNTSVEVSYMKAIILAGGKGTRLWPLTEKKPKPMARIMDVPIIVHTLRTLARAGVTDAALTLGTMDGANVEIFDAVGRENAYVFGMNSEEAEELYRSGYNSRNYYYSSPLLKETVDRLLAPIGGQSFSDIFDYLINDSFRLADPYLCLADFSSYYAAFKSSIIDYKNKREWSRRSCINIAKSGIFSADNSVRKYADEIWHASPIKNKNGNSR